jgi:hypothetical protein
MTFGMHVLDMGDEEAAKYHGKLGEKTQSRNMSMLTCSLYRQ